MSCPVYTDRARPSDCNASTTQPSQDLRKNFSFNAQPTLEVDDYVETYDYIILPDLGDFRQEHSVPIIELVTEGNTEVWDCYPRFWPQDIDYLYDWGEIPKSPIELFTKEKHNSAGDCRFYPEHQVVHNNTLLNTSDLHHRETQEDHLPTSSRSWHSGTKSEECREHISFKERSKHKRKKRKLKDIKILKNKLHSSCSDSLLRADTEPARASGNIFTKECHGLSNCLHDFPLSKFRNRRKTDQLTELNNLINQIENLAASGDALSSIRVTYEMGDPLIPPIATREKKKQPLDIDEPAGDYHRAYDTAFDFARKYGYGFVEFVEETPQKMASSRRPNSATKLTRPRCNSGLKTPAKSDRNNPVYMTKPDRVRIGDGRRVCNKASAKEAVLDHMGIIESAKKDMAMIRKVSNELGKFTASGSNIKSLSPKRYRKSPTKRHGLKNMGTPSPKRSIPSSSPTACIGPYETPLGDNDDEIIQSAPLDKYMAYLSRMCEKIYQEPATYKNHPKSNDRKSTSVDCNIPGDAFSAGQFSQAEITSNLDSCKSCNPRSAKPNSSIQADCLARHPTTLRGQEVMSNILKHRRETLDANKSKNNTPDTSQSAAIISEESPEDEEQVVFRLPKIGEKVSHQYKLYNSISATIYRESQLVKKNSAETEHLPKTTIDVVRIKNDTDTVTDERELVSTDLQHGRKCRGAHEMTCRLRVPQSSTMKTSSITRIRCPHKGSQMYQLQWPGSRDLHKCKRGSDKADSCPNLAMHGGLGNKKIKTLPSRSPVAVCSTKLSSSEGESLADSEMANHMSAENKSPAKGDGIKSETNETSGNISFSQEVSFGEKCNVLADSTTGSNSSNKVHLDRMNLKNVSVSLSNPSGDGEITQLPYSVSRSLTCAIETASGRKEQTVNDNTFGRNSDRFQEQGITNNNVSDTYRESQNALHGECSQAKSELSEEDLPILRNLSNNSLPDIEAKTYNSNNNSLPHVDLSPRKSKISTVTEKDRDSSPSKYHSNVVRPGQADDQPLRLPPLSTHQHSTVGCHDKVYSTFNTCGNGNTFIPIPPLSLPPRIHKGRKSKMENITRGNSSSDKNDTGITQEIPMTCQDTWQNDRVKETWDVMWPTTVSPEQSTKMNSDSPEQCPSSENQSKDMTDFISKLETPKSRPLNQSYVISKAENSSQENEDKTDCSLHLPIVTDQNVGTKCNRKPVKNQNVSGYPPNNVFSHHLVYKTKEGLVQPIMTKTSTNSYSTAKNKDYIPKPKTSSKSPEFAATRHNFEETRETIGFKPRKSSSKSSSLATFPFCQTAVKQGNSNNSGTWDENQIGSFEFQIQRDHIFPLPVCNLSSLTTICKARPKRGRNHNCNAIIGRASPRSSRTHQALQNRQQNHRVSRSSRKSFGTNGERLVSAEQTGIELEQELTSLIRNSRSYRTAPTVYSSRIHPAEYLSDVNRSNTTRRSSVLRSSAEDHGGSPLRTQARDREFMRRRCIRFRTTDDKSPDSVVGEEDDQRLRPADEGERDERQLANEIQMSSTVESGNQYSLGSKAFLPISSHQTPRVNDHRARQCQPAQIYQGIPYCPTTENYWDTSAKSPTANHFNLQSTQFQSCAPENGSVMPGNCLERHERLMQGHMYQSQNQTRLNEEHMEHENVDGPFKHDKTDAIAPTAYPEQNILRLYRHFDALWLSSQREVSQQLKSVTESVNQRLSVLQNFVDENFQKTRNLIKKDTKTNSAPSTDSSLQSKAKSKKKSSAIQLNTTKAKTSGPSHGFPLDISKYTTTSDCDTVGPSNCSAKSSSYIPGDSSSASRNTFPTIHFAEVTPASHVTQCTHSEMQTRGRTHLNEGNKRNDFSKTQKNLPSFRAIPNNRSPLRLPLQRKQFDLGHHARTSRKVAPSNKKPTLGKTYPCTYKSIKQWRQEINNPIIRFGKPKGKLKNLRYRREKHSRSCRLRQRLEGNYCNMCLPVFKPKKKRQLTRPKGKHYRNVRRRRNILGNSRKGKQKPRRRTKRQTVTFKTGNGARRKAYLKNTTQKRKRLKRNRHCIGEKQISKRGRLSNKTSNHANFRKEIDAVTRERITRRGTKPYLLNKTEVHSKNKTKIPMKLKRVSNRQNELTKKLLKRCQNLRKKVKTMNLLHGQTQCSSCNYRQTIDKMVNQFRSLMYGLPKSRLKTFESVLASCKKSRCSSYRTDYRVSRTSPEKSLPESYETPNESANAQRIYLGRRLTKTDKATGMDATPETGQGYLNPEADTTLNQAYVSENEKAISRDDVDTNYMEQMHHRPGFYFFNVTAATGATQSFSRKPERVKRLSNQETPRPVDSLNLIRKNIRKGKDTSKNARCIDHTKPEPFCQIEYSNGINTKAELGNRCDLSPWRITRPVYNKRCEPHRAVSPRQICQPAHDTVAYSDSIISSSTVLKKDSHSTSYFLPVEHNLNKRYKHSQQTPEIHFTNVAERSCKCMPKMKGKTIKPSADLNQRNQSGKGTPLASKSEAVQHWQRNTYSFKPRSSEQFMEKLKKNIYESRLKFKGQKQHTPAYSHHTGIFNVSKIESDPEAENCFSSALDKIPSTPMCSFGTEKHVASLQSFSEEIHTAFSNCIEQSEKSSHTEKLHIKEDVNSAIEHKQDICHPQKESKLKFTNSLWKGFGTCEKTSDQNYKASHLFSPETKDYRSASQIISSTTTTSSTRQSVKEEFLSEESKSMQSVEIKISADTVDGEQIFVTNESNPLGHDTKNASENSVCCTHISSRDTSPTLSARKCHRSKQSPKTEIPMPVSQENVQPLPTLILRFRPPAKDTEKNRKQPKLKDNSVSSEMSPAVLSEPFRRNDQENNETSRIPRTESENSSFEVNDIVQPFYDASENTNASPCVVLQSPLEKVSTTERSHESNGLTNSSPACKMSTQLNKFSQDFLPNQDPIFCRGELKTKGAATRNIVRNNSDCFSSSSDGANIVEVGLVDTFKDIQNTRILSTTEATTALSQDMLTDTGKNVVAVNDGSVSQMDDDPQNEVIIDLTEEPLMPECSPNTHERGPEDEPEMTISEENSKETQNSHSDQTGNDNSCRWLFEQPYLTVNTPGFSTTWTSFVPEPSDHGFESRNSLFQHNAMMNWPSFSSICSRLFVTAANYLEDMDCNRNDNTVTPADIIGSAIPLNGGLGQGSADEENIPLPLTCSESTDASDTSVFRVIDTEEQGILTSSPNVDENRTNEPNMTNSPASCQSCENKRTSPQVSEIQFGPGTELSVTLIHDLLLQGLHVSVISDHSSTGVASSTSSTENNNNAISFHSEPSSFKYSLFSTNNALRRSNRDVDTINTRNNNNENSRLDTASSQSSQSYQQTISNRTNKLTISTKPGRKIVSYPSTQQHGLKCASEGNGCETRHRAIFNNWNKTKTRVVRDGSRKRTAAAPPARWMAPPKKMRRVGSCLSLASQYRSCRRESAALRRARWQLMREIRYLKYRREEKSRLGSRGQTVAVNESTVPPPKGHPQNYSSDADSESSP